MTLAFSNLGSLFIDVIGVTENAKPSRLLAYSNSDRSTKAVVVFNHHRDVRVALDELYDAGFSTDCLTLISRRSLKYMDRVEIATSSNLNLEKFNFDRQSQEFFSRLSDRGKYLILITGSHSDIKAASKIVSRRRHRTQIWHFK